MDRTGEFLECTRYPECKTRRAIFVKTGFSCPKDGGGIIERKSRRGIFYGCANYPNCDFTSGTRLLGPCPSCGSLAVGSGKANAKCTKCDWKGTPEEIGEPELVKASA